MTKWLPAVGRPAGRSLAAALFVVSIIAMGFNLRGAITSVSPVFPELQHQLGLSSLAIAALASIPVLCFGVVSGAGAWLSRKAGEERVLFVALAVLSAGLLLRGAFPGTLLFPGTALAGGAIAVMNVLLPSLVKRRWPRRAGMLIGTYLTFLATGAVVGSLLSVPLYAASGGSARLTLGLWALPALVALLIWLTQVRHRRVPSPAGRAAATAPGRHPRRIAVYRYPLAWQVTAYMGLQSLLYYSALNWLPELFRYRGDSPGAAGNLLALMGVGNLVISLVVPVLAQRSRDQRVLIGGTVALTAVGIAGSVFAPLPTAAVWVLLLGMSQGSALSLAIFFTQARAPDAVSAASLSSFAQAVGYLVATAGTLLVGVLHTSTGSWDAPFDLLLALTAFEATAGLFAARARLLPTRGAPAAATAGDSAVPALGAGHVPDDE